MKSIDWIYFRKGWTSCSKAQKFFEQHEVAIETTVDARKERLDADAAWAVLSSGTAVIAVKGKARKDLPTTAENQVEILKVAMGPSGNLRAPTFKVGDTYLVGFNEEMYEEQLG